MAGSEPSSGLVRLREGAAIPAHPLALDDAGRLDERAQRALTRYYLAAGAGGLAVGVHTTQFAIREHGLLAPVLELAAETARAADRDVALVAGVCGRTPQAVAEATLAREHGYDAGLLSLAALPDAGEDELLAHARAVGDVLPLFGFYLQPAVGGRVLGEAFWTRFAALSAVVAIKVAPFDRYATLDVVRGVAAAGRADDVALYTGNDDHIVADLVTEHRIAGPSGPTSVRFAGGLLGQWAIGTRAAVALFERCRNARAGEVAELLAVGVQLTDLNAALFDAAHRFAGCIAGIHDVLFRQGLVRSRRLLDPNEGLSPGQAEAIDRVLAAYPHLSDEEFVARNRDAWLAD